MPGIYVHPDANLNLRNFTVESPNNKLPDVWVYCLSQFLLSQSLSWALAEGKTSCIMITNPKRFHDLIVKNKTNAEFSDFKKCIYSNDRPTADQDTDLINYYFYKPLKYKRQLEVRFIGIGPNLEPKTLCIPQLKNYVLEVDVNGVDPSVVNGETSGKIIHQTFLKDHSISEFTIKKPFEIYSPVLMVTPNRKYSLRFGRFYNDEVFDTPEVTNCEMGVLAGNFSVFAVNSLEKIRKIVLKSVPS